MPAPLRKHPRRPPAPRAIALAAFLLAAGSAHPAEVLWVGPAGGYWDVASNWSGGLPAADSTVLLGEVDTVFRRNAMTISSMEGNGGLLLRGGTLTLLSDSRIGGLFLNSGTLYSGADLTVNGASGWAGGTLGGTGRTTFADQLTLSPGSQHTFSGRSLAFAGNTEWEGGNFLTTAPSSMLNNGVFRVTGSGITSMFSSIGPEASTFSNSGQFIKTGGGNTRINLGFSNSAEGTVSVTDTGTLFFVSGLSNFADRTLTGGNYLVSAQGVLTWNGADIATNAANITLDGSNARIVNNSDRSDALRNLNSNAAGASLRLLNGRGQELSGAFRNAGILQIESNASFNARGVLDNESGGLVQLAVGTVGAASFNNAGMVSGYGDITSSLHNTGQVYAHSGNLVLAQGSDGSGVLIAAAGASLELRRSSSTGSLSLAGGLTLGSDNLTVSQDYQNNNFGEGNSFNRRAGVTGSGKILAAGNVAQQLSGTRLRDGASQTAVLDLGNVRVGQSATGSYTISNVGDGALLRGAIQTTGISNAALSGSGVTAQNWGALAAGQSSANYTVTFTPTSGGALTGQTIGIVNNFDNVAGQTIAVTGTGWNLAKAVLEKNVIQFGAQRVGGQDSKAIVVTNGAAANGFSERLNASMRSAGDLRGSGSITGLAAGANNQSLRVSLDTSSAGSKSGGAIFSFSSDGSGTSGLGTVALDSQTILVKGNVYAPAVAQFQNSAVDFGIVRVGDRVTRAVSVSNAAQGVMADHLVGGIDAPGGRFTVTTSRTFDLSGGAGTNIGFALDTQQAGAFSGKSILTLRSHNGEMNDLSLGISLVTLRGTVNQLAKGALKASGDGSFSQIGNVYNLDFGSFSQGQTSLLSQLSVFNPVTGMADSLKGSWSIGSGSGFTLDGPFSFDGVQGGNTLNSLAVRLNGDKAGVFDEVLVLKLFSTNASDPAGRALSDITLHLQGTVLAVPEPDTYLMLLGGLLLGRRLRRRA